MLVMMFAMPAMAFAQIPGCTDPLACNFDEFATEDNGSCDYTCYGCTNPTGQNYDSEATQENGSCTYDCVGCLNPDACNYDANAIIDGENCEFETCQGCMDESALNYDEDALIDDQSCIYECAFPEVVWESLDCDETGGSLYVSINVSEVGNAAPYTMINNVSDQVVVISSPNEWILGPFEASDIVVCTLISQAFPSCVTTGPAMSCAVNVSERILPEVSIFPNPASTSIQVNADQEIKEVSLYDKSGRNVLNEQNLSVRSMTLDISTLAPGFYTVRALVGNDVMNQRLVIVR